MRSVGSDSNSLGNTSGGRSITGEELAATGAASIVVGHFEHLPKNEKLAKFGKTAGKDLFYLSIPITISDAMNKVENGTDLQQVTVTSTRDLTMDAIGTWGEEPEWVAYSVYTVIDYTIGWDNITAQEAINRKISDNYMLESLYCY